MSEHTPTESDVRAEWAYGAQDLDVDGNVVVSFDEALAQFDRFIARIKAEAYADGMRAVADWIDGGTPRAYGFEHPCDPPGVRTGPGDHEEALMGIADATREAAARIEKEAGL